MESPEEIRTCERYKPCSLFEKAKMALFEGEKQADSPKLQGGPPSDIGIAPSRYLWKFD